MVFSTYCAKARGSRVSHISLLLLFFIPPPKVGKWEGLEKTLFLENSHPLTFLDRWVISANFMWPIPCWPLELWNDERCCLWKKYLRTVCFSLSHLKSVLNTSCIPYTWAQHCKTVWLGHKEWRVCIRIYVHISISQMTWYVCHYGIKQYSWTCSVL